MNLRKTIVLILGLALLSATGCQKKQAAAVADTAPDAKKAVQKIEAFGTIKTMSTSAVMLDFQAVAREILVTYGQKVKRGDVLIRLDLSAYTDQIRNSEQELAVSRLKLEQLENDRVLADASRSREQKSLGNSIAAAEREITELEKDLREKTSRLSDGNDPDLMKLENDIKAARTDLKKAQDEAERQRILQKEGAVSEQQVENAASAVTAGQIRLESLSLSAESFRTARDRELSQLKLQLGQKNSALLNLRLQLESILQPSSNAIELQREQIRAQELTIATLKGRLVRTFLRGTDIICDLDEAIVSNVNCIRGGIQAAGVKYLELTDLSTLYAEANVPEEFIMNVKPGDRAVVKPVADPKRSYAGTVSSVAGMAVNQNGETVVPVRISFVNDGFLLPLFNIDVAIGGEEEKPEEAAPADGSAPGEGAAAAEPAGDEGDTAEK